MMLFMLVMVTVFMMGAVFMMGVVFVPARVSSRVSNVKRTKHMLSDPF
jgi:hypothetical protein